MKLLNSLFKITNETELNGLYSCIITLDPNHIVYKGHFPGFPVTPGVIQIQILEELIERQLQCTCNLSTIQQSKFLKIINPKQTDQIKVHYKVKQNNLQLNVIAHFEMNGVTYFKFSGVFFKG